MTTTTPTSQTTGSSVAALPTGDNVSSYVAFLGAGPTTKADGWLAVWGAGMLVSGALVYCL